jgi:hypothetical protein
MGGYATIPQGDLHKVAGPWLKIPRNRENEETGRPMGLGKGLKEVEGNKREGKEVRCNKW